ncbi:MAG: 2Fe-2S iron-sulfur cluster binding domain-containing protein [Syntrophaceae bacterium]|nr:2Fe-2S iron-sulfur cluster binding domain-containing protein [Syntrophaceae bacterium]
MNIEEYLNQVEGYAEAARERQVLEQACGDLALPRDFAASVIGRLHPREIGVAVAEIHDETPTAKTFRLAALNGQLPPFRAGQYVNWSVTIGGVRTGRAFSIASPPHERGFYELTVRRQDGGFVSPYLLDEVRAGQTFTISGPGGTFYHEPLIDTDDLVFLAGGSGITPFRSLIRETVERNLPRRIWLIYGSRTPDDVIYKRELQAIARRHSSFKVRFVISDPPPGYRGPRGFITADRIRRFVGSPEGKTFYLCGPEQMYRFMEPELEKLSIPRRRIKRESCGPLSDVTREAGWPSDVSASRVFQVAVRGGTTFPAAAGEPLLNSLERNGFSVPSHCRSGECGFCRMKILSGRVFMPDRTAVRESDRCFNYVHACLTYPLSDLEIRL